MKKSLGITRSKLQILKAAKLSNIKKKNRFKYVGKEEAKISAWSQKQLQQNQNHQISLSTGNSSAQQNSEQQSRNFAIHEEAKDKLELVSELRKKISIQCKARITCFKQQDAKLHDQNICKFSSQAVSHIQAAQKCLKDMRRIKGANDIQEKYIRNIEKSLTQQIRQASKGLRSQQKQYFDRLRSYETGTANIAIQLSCNQKQQMKDLFEFSDINLTIQKQQNFDELDNKERNQQITQLVSSINKLTTIYKDLNQLVIQQGSIIDRIDINIDDTLYSCEAANKNLVKAQSHASSGFADICILILLVGVLIVAIILGYKYSNR